MRLYKADGVVLKSRDYQEAAAFLTLYTRKQGKIYAIAKGVRKQKSSLRGGVQQFYRSHFVLYRGRELDTVTQCESVETFPFLYQDLTRLSFASHIVEVLDKITPEREPCEPLFYLLVGCLRMMRNADPCLVARAFEIRMVTELGYGPSLTSCLSCHRPTGQRGGWFSARGGGIICPSCKGTYADEENDLTWLSPASVATMATLVRMKLGMLPRIKCPEECLQDMGKVMKSHIEFRAERKLHSLEVLNSIKGNRSGYF